MEYIEGTRRAPITIQVPGQLVIRRSCGCCPDKTPCAPPPSQPVTVASTLTQVVQAMADAVLTETEHLHPGETRLSLEKLVAAFVKSIQETHPSHFTSAVTELLQ
jgi:hypothetical protein